MDYFNRSERDKQAAFAKARDNIVSPLVLRLVEWGVTANWVTAASIGFLFVATVGSMLSPIFYWVGMVLYIGLDGLDGPIARQTATASKAGSINDITADQLGVPVVLSMLVYYGGADAWAAALLSGAYIMVIYNMVLYNTVDLKFLPVIRAKYPLFAVAGLYISGLMIAQRWTNEIIIVLAAYYLAMLLLNMVASSRRP